MDKQVLQLENKRLKRENDELKKQLAEITEKESSTTYRNWYNALRAISDNIPDMIWAKDLEKKYILVNKAICENLLNAKDTSEPIGKNDLFFAERERNAHPENPEWHTFGEICQDSDTIVMQSRSARHFDEFGNVKGKFLFLDVHKAPLYDEDGSLIGTVGSARDVTAEMETRKKLIESEEKYRRLFEKSSDPILLLEDGVFVDCNDATLKFLGYDNKDEVVGKKPHQISPEYQFDGVLSKTKAQQLIDKTLQEGYLRFDWQHQNKKGKVLWVNVSLTVFHQENKSQLFTIWRDINDEKKAKKALEQSEKKYRDLFELSPDASVIINVKGFVTDCNEIFNKATGLMKEEVIGKHFTKLPIFSFRDLPSYIRIFSKLITQKKVQAYDFTWKTRDGKLHYSTAHIAPLFDENQLQGFMAITRDITDQKLAERKIRDSEQKYRTLFERANDAIFLMKDGVFVECNPLTYQMFACNREDVIGRRPSEFSPERQPEGMLSSELAPRKIETALKDGSNTFEWKHKRLDGTLFDAEVSLSRLKIGEEDYLQAIVRDISFRKQAEQSLKESKQRYKLLADATREAIFITRKGYCVDTNQTASDIFGYTYDEFIGAYATLIIAPESVELVKKNIHSGYDQIYEAVGMKKDGTKFPVELRGKSFVYRDEEARLTVCRDLTLQKQSEQRIKETTERLKRAEKVAHIGNWEYHLDSGLLIASEGFHEIYGLPPDQNLTIEQVSETPLPEYRQKIENAINALIDTHKPCTYEYQILRITDQSILDISSTVRIDPEKKVIFGIIQDVTERKKFENALKKAKEHAEESDRLKTSFLATISHELRTPLNSIIGYSEIIDETLDKEQIIDFVRTIYKNGNHLLSLIEDMLDISSMESGDIEIEKTHFNLRAFLSKIHQMLKGELQHQKKEHLVITMSYDFKTIDQDIYTDQQRLEKIFQNLINNAVKFTQQGKVEFGFSPPQDNRITFFVKDSGIGIPKAKHEMIFERFRQVEDSNTRKYGGTGLGLYVCKLIVERLGGDISVSSEPGEGSVFSFSLPYLTNAKSFQAEEEKMPETVESKVLTGNTILVAEDESSNYLLVKSILTRAGAEIAHAENGRELLEYLKNNPLPDAILLDIKMPVMDGETALKTIRSKYKNLLVIALTAYAMKGDREKYLRAGCNDYISKPVKKEKLLEVLLKHLKD